MFTIPKPDPADIADMKAGRHINADQSVSPTRDTGFRMLANVPPPAYVPPARPKALVSLPEYIHQDDIRDEGPASIRGKRLDAVRLISIDTKSHIAREARYLEESIIARRERDANTDSDSLTFKRA